MFTTIKHLVDHHLTTHNNIIKVNYSLLTNISTTLLQMVNHIANNLNKDNIFVKHNSNIQSSCIEVVYNLNNIQSSCKQVVYNLNNLLTSSTKIILCKHLNNIQSSCKHLDNISYRQFTNSK